MFFKKRANTWLKTAYQWIDERTSGTLGILALAVQRFNRLRGAEAAASIAYYAIFSLFPLLLLLTSLLAYIVVSTHTPGDLVVFLIRVIPVSSKFVQENLLEIIKQRGTVGIVGLIGLIWSASGVFLTLTRNINRAWPGVSFRNFLQSRLLALVMILVITLLLALWFLATTFFSLLPKLDIPIQGSLSIYDTFLWRLLSGLIPWIIAFIVFVAIYRWIPKTHVRWSEAMWGAAFATIAWESATMLFTWYLSSGLTNYELLYGSLGTILALLTWIYLSALITLFGAHLSAAIAQNRRLKKIPEKEREVEASHHPTLRRSI